MLTPTNGKPERIALYCRVSSEEQAEAGTIQNQVDFARSYCELHKLPMGETYQDEGISGTTDPFQRSAAKRMLADAKAGKFNVLLVYRLDRLSRSLWYLLNVHHKLEEWGVAIRSMTEPLDTSTPVGRFVFQLLGSIAELERETIRQRTELGRERAIANGKALGKRPMGFCLDPEGQLAIDPVEGPLVQEMFSLASSGMSTGAIARALNDRGAPTMWTARGYRVIKPRTQSWIPATVWAVLRNPVYWTGQWIYAHKDGTSSTVPAPPLVEMATAMRAHHELGRNNLKAKGVHRPYLLSGLVRCGNCGSSCVGVSNGTSTQRRYYACNTMRNKRRYPGKDCNVPVIRGDLLDAEVWADIKAVAEDPQRLAAKIRARRSQSAGDVDVHRRELAEAVAEYEALAAARLSAQLRADQGELTREELSRYLRATVGRAAELERRKMELAEQMALLQVEESKAASLEEVCNNLRELVAEAEGDPDKQQQLLKSLVNQVTLTRGANGRPEVEIEYIHSDPKRAQDSPEGSSTPSTSTACRWCRLSRTSSSPPCSPA